MSNEAIDMQECGCAYVLLQMQYDFFPINSYKSNVALILFSL